MAETRLPRLVDAPTLAKELGITKWAASTIMGRLPAVQVAGLRKTYVRREDVEALLAESTTPPGR